MMALLQRLFDGRRRREKEEAGALAEARHRKAQDVRRHAQRVQGAALDSMEKSEATVKAINDLLRRM